MYVAKDYENLIQGAGDPVQLIGGVFLEATAAPHRRINEARWASAELEKSELPYGVVAGCDLT